MPKPKNTKLSVFKGREAKLNRAIIQALAAEEPQTIWDLLKKIAQTRGMKRVRYATINKRVRNLEESGYLRKVEVKISKAGSEKYLYELRPKAYLATFLRSKSLDDMLTRVNDATALSVLGAMFTAEEFDNPTSY